MTTTTYGEKAAWAPKQPRIRPIRLVVAWVLTTASLLVAVWIVPGADVKNLGGFLAAAVLNAILPPLIAALPHRRGSWLAMTESGARRSPNA